MYINRFDSLVSAILCEGEVVRGIDDTIQNTPYDIAKDVVNRLIEDPRNLLPAVEFDKFIVRDVKEKDGVHFEWRYGNNVLLDIKITPNNVFIYDKLEDKILFSTPTTDTPTHDIQDVIFREIEKILNQEKEAEEAGITQPMDIGNQNTAMLPDAIKPESSNTVKNYFKNTTLKNR